MLSVLLVNENVPVALVVRHQCLLCGVQCTQMLLCVAFVVDFVACNIFGKERRLF